MNFGEALEHLRAGRGVCRAAWYWSRRLVLVPGSTITVEAGRPLGEALPELRGRAVEYEPHIDAVDTESRVSPWAPTTVDLLATDWMVWKP